MGDNLHMVRSRPRTNRQELPLTVEDFLSQMEQELETQLSSELEAERSKRVTRDLLLLEQIDQEMEHSILEVKRRLISERGQRRGVPGEYPRAHEAVPGKNTGKIRRDSAGAVEAE